MRLNTFVAFDFETTGLNASKDRIIEIGCVKFDSQFTELERFETLVNPKRDVGRTDIHGHHAIGEGQQTGVENSNF